MQDSNEKFSLFDLLSVYRFVITISLKDFPKSFTI